MKIKWMYPFIPMTGLLWPPPQDMAVRVCIVIGTLGLVVALLAIIQPWKPDPQP